ncbi:MAG: hypothetical protein KGS72_07905 [Cyanobacteria bacterium REEB67]|nr:hypothetical protein [Cyanobacteria bacterium REEB67]
MQNLDTTKEIVDPAVMAQAIAAVEARRYRPGEAFFARYSARYMPVIPEIDYLSRRGVDIVALANALEKNNLDAELFGRVIEYRTWDVDDFNRYIRAGIRCDGLNTGMKHFLDHPRNW